MVLLFMDELPTRKLPWDWYREVRDEDEKMFSMPLYSSTSGILKAWPTEYDPDLITLCKAITNRDWKVTRLILSSSRISDEGLKKLRSALTQSELYSLTLISPKSKSVTNLNVNCNRLGEEGIILLFTFLTSSNCSLINLNVSHYRLGDRVLKDSPEALTNENCKLTSSDIKDNELGDEEIKYLCKALTDSNCKLQSLDLRGNRNITDVEVKG